MRMVIEDRPPYRSYRPTWRYRLSRFLTETDIPFAFVWATCIFLAAACFLSAFFMVG